MQRARNWMQGLRTLQKYAGGCSRSFLNSAAAGMPSTPGQLCRGLPASVSTAGSLASHPCAFLSGKIVVRPFSLSNALRDEPKADSSRRAREKQEGLVQKDEDYQITDQIPEIVKPMGVVEGTSYTVLILAGLAFAAAVVWAVVNELLIQPKEYTCFNMTLKKLGDDPRVTVRLGTPLSGFGQDSRNRQARQRIPHRIFTDANGVEHIQVQFFARGPSGTGRISADLYQDESKQWQYSFLYMDMDNPVPQRVTLVEPQYQFAAS